MRGEEIGEKRITEDKRGEEWRLERKEKERRENREERREERG